MGVKQAQRFYKIDLNMYYYLLCGLDLMTKVLSVLDASQVRKSSTLTFAWSTIRFTQTQNISS